MIDLNRKKDEGVISNPDVSREWIAPKFIILNAGATAGGPVVNTEAYNYRPS